MARRAQHRIPRLVALSAAAWLVAMTAVGPLSGRALAADPPTMTARVLLQGHARLGSWIAIEVHLVNTGPSISGEIRLQGGAQGGTRYATAVQLDSPSDKTWILHAQPPSFGQQLEVALVVGGEVMLREKIAVSIHDPTQLVVGVIAENGQAVAGTLSLPALQNQQPAVIVPLTVADLPTRIEAWSALDRLVWQDVDAASLETDQLSAMRGWLALGGRLVVIGGTAGIGTLGGFPDDLLPYRPSSTVDVAPRSLAALVGPPPKGAIDLPAMAGELIRGRAIATSGDRVIAAQATYGSGSVTILGVDPTSGWIAEPAAGRSLWPALIPPRSEGTVAMGDDSQIVAAVSNLPSLALPPLGGLLLLLVGYVALIGPINYLVLKRIDRREWAWITMPALIVGFAVGAYSFGSALRGSSIIVNEVSVVRGAPNATEGSANVYLGVFSPTRGTYQMAIPGGALLSSPISGDIFGGSGLSLDVIQGDPSRVRNLAVGFGSLRTVRAESQASVPKIHVELALVNGTLTGIVRNDSETKLERPAIVLGGNVKVLKDLLPGEQADVVLNIVATPFGQSLSDKLFGQLFFDNTGTASEATRRDLTRHRVIDQLTTDPQFGNYGKLPTEGPVLLAWGRDGVVDVTVENQVANRVSNVLYYLPLPMAVRGTSTFGGDLIRSTVTDASAVVFNKDPSQMFFGEGSVTIAYRPIAFDGRLTATHVRFSLGNGPDGAVREEGGEPIEPLPDTCQAERDVIVNGVLLPKDCPQPLPDDQVDRLPEIEVFDRTGSGAWHRLPRVVVNEVYDLADPESYVDPGTGAVLFRLVNEAKNEVNAYLNVSIQGTVK